jgi:hypothetical protein
MAAIGYLRYRGAPTDPVGDFYRYQHHPRFSIVQKICDRVTQQKHSQLRGLTQRGEAHEDPPFARAFVQHLKCHELVEIDKNDLVSATPEGRNVLRALVDHEQMSPPIRDFLADWT